MVDPSALVTSIASHGLLGVMLIIVGYVAWSKDKQLEEERAARITDAKNYTDLALKLQGQVIDAVNKLNATFEEMKRLMSPRSSTGSGR